MTEITTNIKSTFFPNSCAICQSTEKLRRCKNCNMISYCGKEHQVEHWRIHRPFCKVISDIYKEQNVSHLYQNFQGLDLNSWKSGIGYLLSEVQNRLNRKMSLFETNVLMNPRVCFVCYETSQELLTNCPGCPLASFCKKHPSSPVHDQTCQKIKIMSILREIDFTRQKFLLSNLHTSITSIQIDESSKLPLSIEEFFGQFVQPKMPLTTNELAFLSNFLNVQLTVFNALKLLNIPDSDLLINIETTVSSAKSVEKSSPYWEVLLHLLPHLKNIRIIFPSSDSDSSLNLKLCKKCVLSKKEILLEKNSLVTFTYMKKKDFKKPNILMLLNIQLDQPMNEHIVAMQVNLKRSSELNCPLVFTTDQETDQNQLRNLIKSTFGNFQVHCDGINKFGSLLPMLVSSKICFQNHFIIVFDPPKRQELSSKSFYAAFCALCYVKKACFPCEKCNMIFYCKKFHRHKHISQHRDICNVVSKMLSETGGSNLFDKLNKTDPESWLKAKIDLMLEVKSKLGRDLSKFEREMFLFPRTCLICHESDVSLLRNCSNCGVILCNIHIDDPKHSTQLCRALSEGFEFSKISHRPSSLKGAIKVKEGLDISEFDSLTKFIDSFYKFNYHYVDDITKQLDSTQLKNFFCQEKFLMSSLHTLPLTLAYALDKLGYEDDYDQNDMVIHVIGATGTEMGTYNYWMIIFFFLYHLKNLNIIFIGPEVFNEDIDTHYYDTFIKSSEYFIHENVNLKVQCYALRYDEFCQSDSFVQPNIVVGYNLNLHECELKIVDCTWENTILELEKLEVPFVLTAGTKNRAEKDHNRLCKLLRKRIDYWCLERNPFAGFIVERDFETEEILCPSQYVIIYQEFLENQDEKAAEKSPNLENPDLMKFSELKISKVKVKID